MAKRCTACGKLKYKKLHFYVHRGCKDGYNTQCKECVKKKTSQWYVANRDRAVANQRVYAATPGGLASHRAARKRWVVAHPDKAAESAARTRALHPEPHRSCEARRRAAKIAQFVEHVDGLVLYERDKGFCGICERPVNIDEFEIDHIKSLASGGDHSYANTQIAHPICNQRKGG